MSLDVVRRPAARLDLIGYYAYLGEQAGEATADRFLAAVDRILGLIAQSPEIGAPHATDNPQLNGLRSFRVSKFKHHIIFYVPHDDRIELVRVLHGARDVATILNADAET
jgi:toxin ParE1/3/4